MHRRTLAPGAKLALWAVCLSGIALDGAAGAKVTAAAEAGTRPNIVFILADDLGPT